MRKTALDEAYLQLGLIAMMPFKAYKYLVKRLQETGYFAKYSQNVTPSQFALIPLLNILLPNLIEDKYIHQYVDVYLKMVGENVTGGFHVLARSILQRSYIDTIKEIRLNNSNGLLTLYTKDSDKPVYYTPTKLFSEDYFSPIENVTIFHPQMLYKLNQLLTLEIGEQAMYMQIRDVFPDSIQSELDNYYKLSK